MLRGDIERRLAYPFKVHRGGGGQLCAGLGSGAGQSRAGVAALRLANQHHE